MRVLVASPLDPSAVKRLGVVHDLRNEVNPSPTVFARALADREVLVLRSGVNATEEVLSTAPDLRLIVRAGSGLDNIDVEHARSRGIRVVRVAGMSGPPVAEMTFALLLSLARKVVMADRLLRAGHWPKAKLGGPLLRGKTLGVVGAGNIGALVGEMARAWGMSTIGCVKDPRDPIAREAKARGIKITDFETVLTASDFVTLHVPLDDSTYHLIDGAALDRMRPGSLLVNMARGGVVDEKALFEALVHGRTLAGAALDVHELEGEGTISPLHELDNVVLTPHIGAMALDSQRLIGERVVDLIAAFGERRLDAELHPGESVA
jgi:D-3-phosphoglycerate dehydrogenase / 2-oxoglutarate reductase